MKIMNLVKSILLIKNMYLAYDVYHKFLKAKNCQEKPCSVPHISGCIRMLIFVHISTQKFISVLII